MERVIKVAVDAAGNILPKSPQYAGVQGEHNACRVAFDVTAWENEPFLYRGEFVGGDGAGGTTAALEVTEGCVSFLLPAAWTAAGGRAVARLVASVTVDGEETQTVYAVDVPLYFAAKQEYGTAVREEAYTGLTALAAAVQTAVDTVEEKLADGSFVGPMGAEGPQGVSGVYVGGGEMPEGYNVQIDPDGDASIRLEIGTVETLGASQAATASVTGTVDEPILNLGIPRGEDGATPTIGDNGNWWINGKDTGNTARCEAAVGEWEEIYNTTLTEAVTSYTVTPAKEYTEVFVQGVLCIETDATASAAIDIVIGRSGTVITRNTVTVQNGTKLYYRAHGWLSPAKTIIYDAAVSGAKSAGNLTRNAGDASTKTFEYFPEVLIQTSNSTTYKLGVGSTITIWGR